MGFRSGTLISRGLAALTRICERGVLLGRNHVDGEKRIGNRDALDKARVGVLHFAGVDRDRRSEKCVDERAGGAERVAAFAVALRGDGLLVFSECAAEARSHMA